MPLTLGDVMADDQVCYDEPQMSSDSDDDRPISPPRTAVPRLEQQPLVPCRLPMSKALPRFVQSRVTCVSCMSPHEFYVRVTANEDYFRKVQDKLDDLCNNFAHHPTDVRKGDLIAVYSHQQKRWCRAYFRAGSAVPKMPAKAQRCSILSKAKEWTISAHLLDYGYTDDNVYLFNTKGPFKADVEPFDLKRYPTVHERCCLSDVQPIDKSGWSKDAIDCTRRLINGKKVFIVPRKPDGDVNHVDLFYAEARGRYTASLALALHMTDHARTSITANYKSTMRVADDQPKYKLSKLPRRGDLFSGVVDFIVSPDRFFVTWASKEKELIELQESINAFYEVPQQRDAHQVLGPLVDLPCIAVFSDDGLYYRALVKDIMFESHKVLVLFVDYGNEEEVPTDKIFHVHESFMETPLLASVCCLADVRPFNTADWSRNATTEFQRLVEESMISGHLSVRIQDVHSDRLSVSLNKWIPATDGSTSGRSISIAEEMIQNKFARRNRPDDDEDVDLYDEFKHEAFDVYTLLKEIHTRSVTADMGLRDRLIDVLVFHVQSPSDMYVQLNKPKVRQIFFSMAQRLNDFMNRGSQQNRACITAETNPFDVDDWCAILLGSAWCRSKVTAKREIEQNGDTHNVFDVVAVDGGYPQKGKKASEVFKLPVEFQQHAPYAIRVSLADISPAGGADWLQVSADKVTEFVAKEEYKDNLYLLMNQPPPESRPEDTLPVALVAVTKEIAGALLPERVTYHVLNDLMVGEWGVAVGARRAAGHRFDTDILNDRSESTICPRATHGVANVPFPENSLISRMQSIFFRQEEEDGVYVYEDCSYPEKDEFQGLVTHVDEQMNVFFQVIVPPNRPIDTVNNKIIEATRHEPLPVMKDNYMEGRACTAIFDFDMTWNRAKILGLSKHKRNHIRVFFVDYGQREEVVAESISSAVVCRDIPPLALKASISGIKWAVADKHKYAATMEELRNILVDKVCSFKWENAFIHQPMKVSIRRPLNIDELSELEDADDDHSDVGQWFINKDMALPDESTAAPSSKS